MSEEAIPERDHTYRLPDHHDGTTVNVVPWTIMDLSTWRWLCRHRPALALLATQTPEL